MTLLASASSSQDAKCIFHARNRQNLFSSKVVSVWTASSPGSGSAALASPVGKHGEFGPLLNRALVLTVKTSTFSRNSLLRDCSFKSWDIDVARVMNLSRIEDKSLL
jgi:hypothetical protein